MASSKVSREKLKRSGSFQKKEPPPPPDENQIPDLKLEDFEMLKTIGTGSFGRVVLCRRKKDSGYYAMKILEISDVIQLKQVDHVKNEKSLLVQVQHPFIIELTELIAIYRGLHFLDTSTELEFEDIWILTDSHLYSTFLDDYWGFYKPEHSGTPGVRCSDTLYIPSMVSSHVGLIGNERGSDNLAKSASAETLQVLDGSTSSIS